MKMISCEGDSVLKDKAELPTPLGAWHGS